MTLDLFRQQMPGVAPFLEGVSPVIPDETYQGKKNLISVTSVSSCVNCLLIPMATRSFSSHKNAFSSQGIW